MASRLILHQELKSVLGTNQVYFQPPESMKLEYPCIIYKLTGFFDVHADNDKYHTKRQYEAILITRDPDDAAIDKLHALQYCSLSTPYASNNLNHYPFKIFY